MVDSRWRRTAALLVSTAVGAGLVCASVIGCGRVIAHPAANKHQAAASTAGKPSAWPFSAAKLRRALLTRVNGVAPVAPAATGHYASLAAGSAARRSAPAIRVTPTACGGATMTGFNPALLAGSPVAATTFRVGKNGVSEMLVASSARLASSVLAGRLPTACAHYKETVDGKSFSYGASELTVNGIGDQARVLNVRSFGATANNLWSLVYRGAGFVGSVTVVGPNASEAAVRELGRQAYTFAVKSLA